VSFCRSIALSALLVVLSASSSAAELSFTRDIDLIYHKQDGYALTMDRVTPAANTNGAAVVMLVSGRWVSRHEFLAPHTDNQLPRIAAGSILNPTELLARGYTLFFVLHGAEPMFTIPEIHTQIGKAVRHIRQNAERYGVDPSRIGMMGGSAGGHLTLLLGTIGPTGSDNTKTQSEQNSRPQAVVAYFPPTDFVNYGTADTFFVDYMEGQVTADGYNRYKQALDLVDHDSEKFLRTKVTDQQRLAQHYRDISPYYHVSADDPPVLLIHGDADNVVPIQQSQRIAKRFDAAGVPYKLHINAGGVHGWKPEAEELSMIADWFDTHLTENHK
jgi:acetyl esterase/lipase